MLGRLNHVGLAVPDMAAAIAFWQGQFGPTSVGAPFPMAEHGVMVCFVDPPGGGTQLELLAPLGEASPVAGFLARFPHGGQHHLAFEVADIAMAHAAFAAQGKRILGPIRKGAHGTPVFFVHPKDMGGVLTEIMQTPDGAH